MIDNTDAVRLIDSKRRGAVMVATMIANDMQIGLPSVTTNEKLDVSLSGAMSKASSLALGLALACPERKVIVLDGDGSLLMNLGSLVTVAEKSPHNLFHFLFDNGVYAVTGGQPVPGLGHTDWVGMANSAGYAASYSFDNLEDLSTRIDEILGTMGPVFIHLSIVASVLNTPIKLRPVNPRNMAVTFRELPEAIRNK
jgi:thiamine pyrophosphate-dependent acetolactate synthase large subunit-like protein